MGGSNSTRRVSFESDENDNVTVVKGVRLSENVINRMREPSKPAAPSPAPLKPSPPPRSGFTVDETELRRKISEEVQKGLEEERSRTQYELHRWLEKERARVKAQANSYALDSAQRAELRDRISAEEEQRRARRLAKQLEDRDQQLRKQDAFYREQLSKLEERSTQFYKVTNESYHKAVEEVNAKFRRHEISPVCADLQGQILRCYRENAGKTLVCSSIASLYMQCVNGAKQNKLRAGG